MKFEYKEHNLYIPGTFRLYTYLLLIRIATTDAWNQKERPCARIGNLLHESQINPLALH